MTPLPATASVPPLIVVPPLELLLAESVSVPEPRFVTDPLPSITKP